MDEKCGRLLVIDNDEKLAKLIGRMLAPEHDVLTLTSATEALRRAAAGERFDLILCDIIMPEVTGIAFHERLSVVAPELVSRVVFITGGAPSPTVEAFLERGSIHLIEKPFPPLAEFRRVVRDHLRRVGGSSD